LSSEPYDLRSFFRREIFPCTETKGGHMNRTKLALLAVLAIPLASALAAANQPAPQQTATAQEKFYVYGGGCSRSIRLQGTYETIRDAYAAAEKGRSEGLKYVSVRTGEHDRDYFGNAANEYKVYSKTCKSSWKLYATVASADKAKEMADQLQKGGSDVEIVRHYFASAAAAPGKAKGAAAQAQGKTVTPQEKFYVYGASCRTIRLQGTYQTIEDACAAAATFRSAGLCAVSVRTGDHERDYDGSGATQYKVYERSLRCGNWFLRATVDTAAKAQAMAGQMAADRCEIVLHYASPSKP
jgi:hypothetical protein